MHFYCTYSCIVMAETKYKVLNVLIYTTLQYSRTTVKLCCRLCQHVAGKSYRTCNILHWSVCIIVCIYVQSIDDWLEKHEEYKILRNIFEFVIKFFKSLYLTIHLQRINVLKWESRITLKLNVAKITNYIKKMLQIKVVQHYISYIKSMGAHVYRLQEWGYEAPKIDTFQILYCTDMGK